MVPEGTQSSGYSEQCDTGQRHVSLDSAVDSWQRQAKTRSSKMAAVFSVDAAVCHLDPPLRTEALVPPLSGAAAADGS